MRSIYSATISKNELRLVFVLTHVTYYVYANYSEISLIETAISNCPTAWVDGKLDGDVFKIWAHDILV